MSSPLLTLEAFRSQFGSLKPQYEFWDGVAQEKSIPTWLHGLLQRLIANLLAENEYKAGTEVELRISPKFQPIPDVIGALTTEHPYPTKPVEIVVEILSPEDRAAVVIEKCRKYTGLGIKHVYVFDPEMREAGAGFEWHSNADELHPTSAWQLPNGNVITMLEIWKRLDDAEVTGPS